MYLSQKDATEKWCPFAGLAGNNRCINNGCMAWRWIGEEHVRTTVISNQWFIDNPFHCSVPVGEMHQFKGSIRDELERCIQVYKARVSERYFKDAAEALENWVPTSPKGEGWKLTEKYIEEDCESPYFIAIFARDSEPNRLGFCGLARTPSEL